MNQKRKYKIYSKELKQEAVALVTKQDYSVVQAAESVTVNPYQFISGKMLEKRKPMVRL